MIPSTKMANWFTGVQTRLKNKEMLCPLDQPTEKMPTYTGITPLILILFIDTRRSSVQSISLVTYIHLSVRPNVSGHRHFRIKSFRAICANKRDILGTHSPLSNHMSRSSSSGYTAEDKKKVGVEEEIWHKFFRNLMLKTDQKGNIGEKRRHVSLKCRIRIGNTFWSILSGYICDFT